ncbi:Vitellogenin-2 [Orchesella cincta]|uniref:Vitellogenin-2 n=1 Tax=Orchesella cincta TaxID=48709 RepID=A0A1D2NET9_ORCCI|nr:Vitellogenin-2 [Orchesella cincta]
MKYLILLGLVLSSSAFVKRDVGSALFQSGKEYVYGYSASLIAGSKDYVSFASAVNLTGELHIQGGASVLNVQLNNIQLGLYNGEWEMNPLPQFERKTFSQLAPLSQPFAIKVEGGLAKGIVLNKDIPIWAQNMQRGIASALQLNLAEVDLTHGSIFQTEEETVVGECVTEYVVIPGTDSNHGQVRKYRSHAQCKNNPRRVRAPGISGAYCPDANSRDVLNSTGFGVYDLEIQDGSLAVKRISVGSSVVYNLFGVDGHTQYSFGMINAVLKEVKSGSVAGPANGQEGNHLEFVFENDNEENEDLRSPKPFFFHHHDADLDTAGQNKAADKLVENIKKVHESLEHIEVFTDIEKFHKVSPFSIIPFVSALDYNHLKQVEQTLKGGDLTEYKLFLDALVVAGTGPATLVIRDIVQETTETVIIGRIVAPLANYVRNPTENLLVELEPLLSKSDVSKHGGRIIEFAFASLVGRTCKRDGCQKSGLLQKYVKIFSDRIVAATGFEEKTQAVIALRNINLPAAAQVLLTVVTDKNQDRTVRDAAMSGLKPLLIADKLSLRNNLLPIFFDRQEDPELRTHALMWTLMNTQQESLFQEAAVYMWTEQNPNVKNFVITLFRSLAFSTKPCLSTVGSYAKTASQILPPFKVSGKFSGQYISDYYDRQFNFGHMTVTSVQKSGLSVLPRSVHIGFYGQTAGFGTNYLSFFLRLEGVGKALSARIMSMTTGVVDFDDLKDVLSKIGVEEREAEPLRIEVAVLLHNRVVAYHAADAKTVTTIPNLIKKLSEYKNAAYDKEIYRMLLIGGATVEKPNELGTPVSIISAVTATAGLHATVSSEKTGTTLSRNYNIRLQLNLHGQSSVNNHLPAFGSAHTVRAVRTLRIRVPRKMSIGLDIKQQSVNFVISAPTEDDPVVAKVHASASTEVHNDAPASLRDTEIVDLLHQTCPACQGVAQISKGEKYRETRQLGSGYKYKFMEGIKAGVKYFDCEKIHSRIHVLRSLRKFFGPENKNVGGRLGGPLTQIRLGARYLLQTLFLSPPTETCGLKAYFKQDPTAQSVYDKLEGQIKIKYEADPKEKLGLRVQAKASLNAKYIGAVPKTKNLDAAVSFATVGIEKVDVKIKAAVRDETAGRSGVVCVDINSVGTKVSDFFDYEGVNEPTYERTINIVWGKEEKAGKEGPTCPTNAAGIKIVRVAHRSQAQKDEAQSDRWPYKQCREAKASPKYPGDLTPATEPCVWAAFKQTQLREANVTINYRVDPEARKRWRYPGVVAAALLMPYYVPSDEVDASLNHAHGEHGPTADGKYIQGSIKLDVALDEEHPEADIHFHSSQGEDEHFHGVDLSILPGPFKRPVFSRFSPLQAFAMQYGVYGYCDVTPAAVQTYDNLTYFADMSECPTLISGDCSKTPRYLVLGHKTANDKLGITAYLGEHKVDINDLNTVTIDGKAIALSDKIINNEGDSKIFKIYKHDEHNVFILSQPLSVYIRYTEHYTTVTLGSRYRGTQCGVCGNFDGCNHNELTGPQKSCKNLSPQGMMKAYVVRDGNCAGVGSECPA